MTSEVRVEQLSPDDWTTWRELRLRALADAPTAFGRTYEEERAYPDAQWRERALQPNLIRFVARSRDEVIGGAATFINPEEAETAYIFGMWVDEACRRRGVARMLLDRALEGARELGGSKASLSVTLGNDGARDLYLSVGFTDTGVREPLREGSDLQIAVMELSLT